MSTKRQRGFSLLELMIALMIISMIATLGFKQYKKYSAKARHVKAFDTVKTVGEGLDQFYLKHGTYPELASFENMVEAGSPLVKENLIPVNVPAKDPWGQPYEGKSTKGNYDLKCQGDPSNPDDPELGAFTREPGKITGSSGDQAAAPPAAGGTK